MINVVNTFSDLFAYMEEEKLWFTMLAFIYVRAGSPADSSALEAQRKLLVSYAEDLGLKYAFILEEIGGTGQAVRPQFKEMIEYYNKRTKGACPPLIAASLDRLSRRNQGTIFDLISNKSLEIHLVQINKVLSDKPRPYDFPLFATTGFAGFFR